MANFGLGMAAIGRPGYINVGHGKDLSGKTSLGAMRKNAHAVLDAAWEEGIRYFDTARSYGRAEEFLGAWIQKRNITPDQINVGSKWGYTYTAAWQVQTPVGIAHEVKRHQLKVLRSQYAATLKNLGSHLRLFQIHSATLDSGVLENQEILDLLNLIREAGFTIGLSVTGPNQSATIDKALAIKFDGTPLFGSVQATWNLLERSAEAALTRAHQKRVAVIVKEGLANGRLTKRNQMSEFATQIQLLQQVAREMNTTVDALALAACLNQTWATTILSGAATPDQVRSNVAGLKVDWNDAVDQQLASIVESPEQYWTTRSNLAWN